MHHPGHKISSRAHVPSHRGPTRYKEKFQELREKYEQVNAKREQYETELAIASAKIARLQAENDLLLDSLQVALDQTTPPERRYTAAGPPHELHRPPPEQYPLQRAPSASDGSRRTPSYPHSNGSSNPLEARNNHHAGMSNGVVNGSTNGTPRHPAVAQEDQDMDMDLNDRAPDRA